MSKFSTYQELPKCTPLGFEVVQCPEAIWQQILEIYRLAKEDPHIEGFPGKERIIGGGDTEIYRLDFFKERRDQIHKALQPLHEAWAGRALIPTFVYGIRSYLHGTNLEMHRDRIETHHISSIIIVATAETQPWPLHIEDHTGKLHKIYTEPGQIILYESATCLHGRPELFQGEYYRNFYVHYKFVQPRFAGQKAEA